MQFILMFIIFAFNTQYPEIQECQTKKNQIEKSKREIIKTKNKIKELWAQVKKIENQIS